MRTLVLAATVIFLNRHGGHYEPANEEDSRRNLSSLPTAAVDMPEFPYGDESWERVLACVRGLYAPFDAEITDVDPGEAPHVEAVVSGTSADIGWTDGIAGLAPFNCEIIPNAVVYTFAGSFPDDPMGICEVTAQEVAHAFAVDHEMLCDDVMSYLGCEPKTFRDAQAACGTFEARPCQCGGDTQNSYQALLAALGRDPRQADGCGCRVGRRPLSGPWLLLPLLALRRRRR